jgi:hypothetical protein
MYIFTFSSKRAIGNEQRTLSYCYCFAKHATQKKHVKERGEIRHIDDTESDDVAEIQRISGVKFGSAAGRKINHPHIQC